MYSPNYISSTKMYIMVNLIMYIAKVLFVNKHGRLDT